MSKVTLAPLPLGTVVTKDSLDAALATEQTWAGVSKKLGTSGSTATTKLWKTWARWHPDEPLPIAPPGRGRAGAAGGVTGGGSKVKTEKVAPPLAAGAEPAAVDDGVLFW